MTELLFNNDAYLKQSEAVITHIDQNSIQLDRTIFYAESGGQPGDQGEIILGDQIYKVIDTQKGKAPNEIIHLVDGEIDQNIVCLLYTSPRPRDRTRSRMPSSA